MIPPTPCDIIQPKKGLIDLMNKGKKKPNKAAAAADGSHQTKRLTYRFMYDIVVKMVFSQNPDLLQNLVARLLKIDPADIKDFKVTNTEIAPDSLGEKFCRLDIVMKVDEKLICLEIQIADEKDFIDRSTYYLAREYSSALPVSGKYTDLPQTIIISIIDFTQFKNSPNEYYSKFMFMEVKRHELLTDKLCMIYCELPKLPNAADICSKINAESSNNDEILKLWLSLFKAESEKDLTDIESMGVDVLSKAVSAYRTVTTSDDFKELERIRARARHNEAQAIYNAEQKLNEHWQGIVAEKDDHWQGIVDEKDDHWQGIVAEKDALIARLQAMITGNNSR